MSQQFLQDSARRLVCLHIFVDAPECAAILALSQGHHRLGQFGRNEHDRVGFEAIFYERFWHDSRAYTVRKRDRRYMQLLAHRLTRPTRVQNVQQSKVCAGFRPAGN